MIWVYRILASLSVALVGGILFFPFGNLSVNGPAPSEYQISVPARPLEVVCPGSLYQLGGEDGTEVDSVETVGDADFFLIQQGESTPYRADKPAIFEASGESQFSSELSGYQWQRLNESRIAGLAALTCKKPVTEAWLLGGKTNIGSESLLIIHNPDVLSTILDMTFYSERELVNDSTSLAPGETKVINLGRFVSTDQAVGINLSSQGGRFAAWVQSKTNAGISPTGVDIEAHNQLQTNPSMIISALSDDLPAEFRIPEVHALVTAPVSSIVSISSLDGGFGDAFRVDLEQGVNQITLPNLDPGSYRITLEADQGILSARTTNPVISDFFLTQSEQGISGDIQMVAVIDGKVEVASIGESVATLKVTRGGETVSALIGEVSGQKMLEADVATGDLIEISGEGLLVRVTSEETEYVPADNSNLGSDLSITVR